MASCLILQALLNGSSPYVSLHPSVRCGRLLCCLHDSQEAADDDTPGHELSSALALRNCLNGLCCLHDAVECRYAEQGAAKQDIAKRSAPILRPAPA